MQTLTVRVHADDLPYMNRAFDMLNKCLTDKMLILKQERVNEISWEVTFMFFDPTALISIGKVIGAAKLWEQMFEGEKYPFASKV